MVLMVSRVLQERLLMDERRGTRGPAAWEQRESQWLGSDSDAVSLVLLTGV